jgi:putative integral membrane protein (TIGR02587 family)
MPRSARNGTGPRRPGGDSGWPQEGRDLLQAIAAGAIVGVPLLYTMEMWQHAMIVSQWHLLVLLAVTLAVNFAVCVFSGFREIWTLSEAAAESVTAVAMGFLFSLAVLWLIGEITFASSLSEIAGPVLFATIPVSLGIAFANTQLRGRSRGGDAAPSDPAEGLDPAERQRRQLREDLRDLGITIAGAVVFAFNVAPTEEVVAIAQRLPTWLSLVMMAASLLLCYNILFAAGFRDRPVYVRNVFQHPVSETVMAYAVALLVSLGLLYMVGMPEALAHPAIAAKSVVALALPAVVGASAGRLIV